MTASAALDWFLAGAATASLVVGILALAWRRLGGPADRASSPPPLHWPDRLPEPRRCQACGLRGRFVGRMCARCWGEP